MRSRRLLRWLAVCLLAGLLPCTSFAQTKYVRITTSRVNIRTAPSTASVIVGKARKGDVFELHGKEGKWYRIRMFTPEWRFVYRSLAEAAVYVVSGPSETSTRREIFRALIKAEDRAETEADRKYPLEDRQGRPLSRNLRKNIDYMWLLNDRYKLRVMHRFSAQPPIHENIISEGVRKNW